MKSIRNLFSLILIIVIAGSCAVEKRQHMNGYHISFLQKSAKKDIREEKITNQNVQNKDRKRQKTQKNQTSKLEKLKKIKASELTVSIPKKTRTLAAENNQPLYVLNEKAPALTGEPSSFIVEQVPDETSEKQTEHWGLISFIASLAAFVIYFIHPITFFIASLLFTASLFFASRSLAKFKTQPEKWKGKGFAITAIALSALFLLLTSAIAWEYMVNSW